MSVLKHKDGPGLWWQFLEFMGMTWPGHPEKAAEPSAPPACASCHNTMTRADDGAWRCEHHPDAHPLEG